MERLTLPARVLDDCTLPMMAFDAGGFTMKILYISKEGNDIILEKHTFAEDEFDKALSFMKEEIIPKVPCLLPDGTGTLTYTGVDDSIQRQKIKDVLQVRLNVVEEFLCIHQALDRLFQYLPRSLVVDQPPQSALQEGDAAAARALKGREIWASDTTIEYPMQDATLEAGYWNVSRPLDDSTTFAETNPYPCILAVLGSAIINFKIHGKGQEASFLEYSPRCGRSFLALAGLMTGVWEHSEVMQMAAEGNTQAVDVLVGDTSGSLDSDNTSTRYSLGKTIGKQLSDFQKKDVIRGLLAMAAGGIVECVMSAALREHCNHILFAGSFAHNPTVRHELTRFMMFKRTQVTKNMVTFEFVKLGSHLGALGALLSGSSE